MNLLSVKMRHLRTSITSMILVLLSLAVLAEEVFAAEYDFAGVGTASGGFKPQGNRFLVSDKFENDEAPNTTAIWYNNVSASDPRTITGMIIKADGTNLTSFNMTDMKFTIYPLAGSAEDISSLKIIGTKVGGATVDVTVNPPSTAAGASFTLVELGASLSTFTGITQLTFDITTNNAVYNIDFSTITLANEVYPTIDPPTTQATNAQAAVVGSTELTLGWTNGNGGSRVVFAKQGTTSGAPTPINGTTYTANSVFTSATDIGGGWKCVYNGNGSFAPVSGLTASTQYRFVVFEYNGSSGNEKYLNTGVSNAANQSTIGSLGDWTRGDIQTLNAENFWTWTDSDRDAGGNTYVVHRYSGAGMETRVEKWNGASWSTLTSFTPATAGYTGFSDHSSIAVSGTNQVRLVVCANQSGSGTITEAKYNGSAWSFSNADATSITNTSLNDPVIAVDGNGNSHILYEYSDAVNRYQYIKLASWSGSAWTTQTLSTIANDNDVDNGVQNDYLLLNDASNKQHVFYIRMTTSGRELHHWTNSTSPVTDTTIFTGNTNSPYKLYGAIDTSGKFHLAYGEDALFGRKVMYSTDKSGSWATQPLLISTAGWQKGFAPLELRINGNGDMVIPVRSQSDKVFKALLKQGSNPWKISALSPVDALTDDWEDTGFSYNTTGTVFRDDGKVLIAYANGLSARPRKLMYTMVSLTPPNTAPTFVGVTTTLTVSQNAPATDIKGLLHVSDSDSSQTETWSQSAAPNHGGTLSFSGATATSGTADITPGGTITYTPANGYSGTETFTVQVSDGTATATRTITVTVVAPPTVTDAKISISGASGTGGAFKIGDTVTATWNNTAAGDNNTGITTVTVDFNQFGGAAVAASNSAGTWTATYTIVAGAIDSVNRNVSVTASNGYGSTTTADSTNATVDNVAPTVTDARISISGASGTGGAYKIGNTVTASWNNTAGGDANSDTISSVTVNFSSFGGGAAVAATNSGGTWTATYTIVAGAIDATNRNVSVTATDNAGNSTTTSDTTNATVDNIVPTVTDARINISGASGTGGAFKIGDIVTATWNNTATGDNNSDISSVSVDFSQFGGGAAVSASNSAGTWTATYTIVTGAIDATNRNISVTATDNAGNSTTTADSTNATVDNIAPTIGSGTLAATNDYIDITFSEGIYGASDGVTPLSAANLALTFAANFGSTSDAFIFSVKNNDSTDEASATPLSGGETTVRVFLATLGIPVGLETIEIKPAGGASVFDRAGNAMSALQTTGVKTLNNAVNPAASVIVVDPDTPATLYAGVDGAGIFKSSDNGLIWSGITTQPVNKRIKGLVMHPTVHTTLFAASFGGGVYKSTDSGDTWSACGATGLTDLYGFTLAVDPDEVLYVGTKGGVFASSDCITWSAVNNGLTVNPATPPMAIAIGPGTTLYAGLAGTGVFMSSDSGATWTAATKQPTNLQVRGLVIQPGDATKLYLATYGNGVFKSTDSGAVWSPCGNSGLTNAKVLSLVMDAAGRLYAGTYGGVFVSSDACATWTAINGGLP
jgi:hypothetical protein